MNDKIVKLGRIFGQSIWILILIISFTVNLTSAKKVLNTKSSAFNLNQKETELFNQTIQNQYPESQNIISELPYSLVKQNLDLYCRSAILIDADTGSILFEKNADEEIPPASMTKLVEMYVVLDAIENGDFSLDDIVPLFEECYAENLPPDASRMLLGRDQTVTLRELLLGINICSGNDASIAVASYICGDMNSFVERMNQLIESLGLEHTHFVESSGYSEENKTTARDFVQFCRIYLQRFPYVIEEFHSQRYITYPQEKNLPDYQKALVQQMSYTQYNTNKLLGKYPGVDGLKTGYIDESGFNLSLTCLQNGTRLLAVQMGGIGNGTYEGNIYRNADGKTLLDYGYSTFSTFHFNDDNIYVPTLGSFSKGIKAQPLYNQNLTVPYIAYTSAKECEENIVVKRKMNKCIVGSVKVGQIIGFDEYYLDDKLLYVNPIVATKSTTFSGFISLGIGSIVNLCLE